MVVQVKMPKRTFFIALKFYFLSLLLSGFSGYTIESNGMKRTYSVDVIQ
jgi:hypothetical protein